MSTPDSIYECEGRGWEESLQVTHHKDGIKFYIDQGSRYDYGEIVITVEQAKQLAQHLIDDFE